MFYYDRTAVRLGSSADLPSSGEPMYCILNISEWVQWDAGRRATAIAHLTDQQGDPIVLVRVDG
jgi:hypothetical protein